MDDGFETRYEWLRPGQLIARREECPLMIVPLAPLEYHGPHLPLGTDPINAAQVAHACCAKLRKGVVRPTLTVGTERERDPAMVESLGFEPGTYVVGMDFPSRLWNSHYLPEEVFALMLAAELRILIGQGYRYVFIANGHGAYNHLEVVRRLCIELSNTTQAKVDYHLTITREAMEKGWAGHADVIETSLLMYYDARSVDLGTLPPRETPLHYKDFSICDGAAFSSAYDRQHVVRHDCRDATAEQGRRWFEDCVAQTCEKIEKMLT